MNTQQSFEQLNQRAVAVVIEYVLKTIQKQTHELKLTPCLLLFFYDYFSPVQSVKGKVVIDAFRLINPQGPQMLALPQV